MPKLTSKVVVVALGVVGVGLVAAWLRSTGQVDPRALVAALDGVRDRPWAGPAFVLLFGVATTLLTPAMVLYLVGGAVFGLWPGALLGWLGAFTWSMVHFVLGRWVAGPRTRDWLGRRGFNRLARELATGGVLATIIVRQLPLPFLGVNLAAGASPIVWWRFAIGNALGLVPGAVVFTYSASAILSGVEGARTGAMVRTLLGAGAIIALGLLSRWAQARLNRSTSPT